jgi:DNA-binding LytR/AlgR family response regulator
MIKIGEHIRSVTVDKILFFYAEGRNAYITTDQGRRLIIDYKLEDLETILDPKLFFRVNRTFIININAIDDVIVYSNSRLKIITEVKAEKEIIVSREKVGAFKQWFDGE